MLIAGTFQVKAQNKSRDVLFPTFQQDLSRIQAKQTAAPSKESQFRGRSVKEMIFTDYKPQTAAPVNSRRTLTAAPGNKSGLSSDTKPDPAALKAVTPLPAVKLPDQGAEPALKAATPIKQKP